jgi:hypothetical protein
VPDPSNPQTLNRYSYCLNNPLKYVDPSGRNYEEYMRLYGGQVGGEGGSGASIVGGTGTSQPSLPIEHPTLLGYMTQLANILMWPQQWASEQTLNSLLSSIGKSIDITPSIIDISNVPESQREDYLKGIKLGDLTVQAIIALASIGVAIYSPVSDPLSIQPYNPLRNIKYSDKIINEFDMGLADHCFPWEVDNYGADGVVTLQKGGDGIIRLRVDIYGSYNGVNGKFDYIIEPDGSCRHRWFIR